MLSVSLAERYRKVQEDISRGRRRALMYFFVPKDTGRYLSRPPTRVDVLLCSKRYRKISLAAADARWCYPLSNLNQKIQEDIYCGWRRALILSSLEPKDTERYPSQPAARNNHLSAGGTENIATAQVNIILYFIAANEWFLRVSIFLRWKITLE